MKNLKGAVFLRRLIRILAILFALSILHCSASDKTEKPGELNKNAFGADGTKGAVTLLLTDFPIENRNVISVIVNFRSIEVNSEVHGWQTVVDFGDAGKAFDLLQLQNGVTSPLGSFSLDPGTYDQMRFILNDANYVVVSNNGVETQEALKTPSATKTGIKLVHSFTVDSKGYTVLTIDFDAQKSIQYNKSQGFTLKPVISVIGAQTSFGAGSLINASNGGSTGILGKITLNIPPGALAADTNIEILPANATQPQPFSSDQVISQVYELLPNGLNFLKDIEIAIDYDNALLNSLNIDANTLEVVYFDTAKNGWVAIPGGVNTAAGSVNGFVNHFTTFGVKGGGGKGPRINPADINYAATPTYITQVPQTVTATIKDPQGVQSADLYINNPQTGLIGPIPMTLIALDQYEVLLDLALFRDELTPSSLDVYIVSTDAQGNISYAPATAPATWHTYAYNPDLDGDGINDRWEAEYGLNPNPADPLSADASGDLDNDGYTNIQEYQYGTNPSVADKPAFTLGGTVTGLQAGGSFTLQNNSGEVITVNANGAFTFINPVADQSTYTVTVASHPQNPPQSCSVTNHTGTINLGPVNNVTVTCSSFPVIDCTPPVLQNRKGIDWKMVAGHFPQKVFKIGDCFLGTSIQGTGISSLMKISDNGIDWYVLDSARQQGISSIDELTWNGSVIVAAGFNGGLYATPDAVTWTRIYTSSPIFSVMWDGSKFIALGRYGLQYTSTDGYNWTYHLMNNTGQWYSLAKNGTNYVGVGQYGGKIYSTDGYNWFSGNQGDYTMDSLEKVVTDGTQFVASGGNGTIMTSPTGQYWTLQNTGTPEHLRGMAYINNTFFAVGSHSTIIRSTDALTWTTVYNDTKGHLMDLYWTGSQYAAINYDHLLTSGDGINWTNTVYAPLGSSKGVWDGNRVVLFNNGIIYSSVDGLTWNELGTLAITNVFYINKFFWNGSEYIISTTLNEIYRSPDAVNWTKQTFNMPNPDPQLSYVLKDVEWDGSKYTAIVAGSNYRYQINKTFVLQSNDLVSWTKKSVLTDKIFTRIHWNGSQYTAIGTFYFNLLSMVSTDGVNWQSKTVTTNDSYNILDIAWNGSKYVAVGGVNWTTQILTSTDGLNWTPSTPAPGMWTLYDVEYDGSQFIAAGLGLYVSPDGVTWTRVSDQIFYKQIFDLGTRLLAVGDVFAVSP